MTDYWVDGSNKGNEVFSYGCVTVRDGEVVAKDNQAYRDHEFNQYRNVAGECFGALRAIQNALNDGETEITIYHDYIGIQKWGDLEWRANNPLSQLYRSLVKQAKEQNLQIHFVKVKAHTGVEYNELADQLAKEAIKNLETKGEM